MDAGRGRLEEVRSWGEDGLAGISDDRQLLCFALASWNCVDPILTERVLGLTSAEGNHAARGAGP